MNLSSLNIAAIALLSGLFSLSVTAAPDNQEISNKPDLPPGQEKNTAMGCINGVGHQGDSQGHENGKGHEYYHGFGMGHCTPVSPN